MVGVASVRLRRVCSAYTRLATHHGLPHCEEGERNDWEAWDCWNWARRLEGLSHLSPFSVVVR